MSNHVRIKELQDSLNFEHDSQYLAVLDSLATLMEVKTTHAELIRLMAVPLIYSCWEGFFKTATAKCLIVIRDYNLHAKDATAQQRAVWLKKAPFFTSYVDMIRNLMELDADAQATERHAKQKSKVKKGQHALLSATLEKLDVWNLLALDKAIEPESLILTFSNVNKDVVDLNAAITGLDKIHLYSLINFSQLEALVGKRNSIGHGGISDGDMLSFPGGLETKGYVSYTRSLIAEYRDAVLQWLEAAKN
jgi:hypothetical protein